MQRSTSGERDRGQIGPVILALGVGILVLGLLVYIFMFAGVSEGHVGVHKTWGGAVTGQVHDPGVHGPIMPWESIQTVEVRPRTYTMSATAGEGQRSEADAITVKSINGSSVDVDVTVRYHIRPGEADGFVSEWNHEDQMEQRLIRPTVRSDLRDEASNIQTSDIYTRTGRERLASTAREALREQFSGQPIQLEAVQVRNIGLPDSIDQALDEKEEAKQRVQVERERVRQEQARAEQQRVQARADADVIRIQGESLRENRIVLEQRYIDALANGAVFVVPADGGSQMILDGDALETAREGTSTSGNRSVLP